MKGGSAMKRRRIIGAALLVVSVGLAAGAIGSGGIAAATPATGTVTPELIGAGSLPTGFGIAQQPGKSSVVARVTFAPNSSTGWHTHPGKTLVVIQSGELTVYRARDKSCTGVTYGPGDGFVELPSSVHIGRNESSDTPTVAAVVFFGVGADGATFIDQPDPGNCDF
jgi:quercetin dioxygenase-like cupin family protein